MNAKFSIAFAIIFAFVLITPSFQNVLAEKNVMCSEGKILVYRINSDKYACLNPSSASNWYQKGIAEPVEQIMSEQKEISAEFPFESKYVEVLGSKMHYIDEGQGDPILFLHGNPTSSYLWRNVIPYLSDDGRAIAVDLIGMGKSDKPDIDYSFDDHARYLDAFIEELELKDVTLVIHDWGSGLGFNYAANNEDNIKGIAFMEALLMPMSGYDAMPSPEMVEMFKNFRTPGIGEELIMNQNIFVEQLLPGMVVRELSEEELNYYREPYPTPESLKPVWKWPNEIPIGGEPKNTHDIISSYNQWLQTTETPMLMIYATPGILGNEMAVQWAKDNLNNLKVVNVGEGLHFIQEDNPDAIGEAISDWYQTKSTISESIMMYTQEAPTIDPEKGYFVTEIADGLYWLSNGLYQIMFLTTGEGVIVVDAPPSMGESILSAIDEVTDEPITHVIYSHIHQDHIGAAYIFPEDAMIISHQDTATHLAMKNDPNRPVPTETFDDTYTLTVGEQTLELSYEGAFHSKGDIMIFAPKQNVLMVVDHFLPGSTPFKEFALSIDMNNYIAAHDLMIEKNPALIISGHTKILATTDHVKISKEYTMNVLENAGMAFQTVDFNQVTQEYGQGTIAGFVAYLDALTQTCADLTMEQWDGKLDNLGIFREGHCSEMVLHIMLD